MKNSRLNDSLWIKIIYIISIVITLVVAFLILGPRPSGIEGSIDVSGLPFINASLNFISTVLLISALWFIKNKNIQAHKNMMLGAFAASAMFLVTYVIYHWFKSGPKLYTGEFIISD